MAKSLRSSDLNLGFDDALSARYSFTAALASGSLSGVKATKEEMAVEYSLSSTTTSLWTSPVDFGLIAGTTVSVMARSVFHCAGVKGSSSGSGGSGVALGETGAVARDMLFRRWLH